MTIIVEGLNERNMTAQAEQMKAGHCGFCDGANARFTFKVPNHEG
jgi:hypothetical protein